MGDEDGLKCWHSHRKWKQQPARWTQIADLQKCVTKKSLWTKKLRCLCPQIEYFGISVPFCYYSLLGRVIDFPSRVRVVKKFPSTGRVASTRHSLLLIRMRNIHIGVKTLLAINLFISGPISLYGLFSGAESCRGTFIYCTITSPCTTVKTL